MFCLSAQPSDQQQQTVAGGPKILALELNEQQSIPTSHSMDSLGSPTAGDLEKALDFSGLIMTSKNVADEEDFDIEIVEVFNVSYLPLHSLFALPVCWASAKLRPVKNMPLNTDMFDDEDDVLEIAAVLAFPKEAKKLITPVTLDVSRCGRITLPPKKGESPTDAEDALLIYSYVPREDTNKLKSSPVEADNKLQSSSMGITPNNNQVPAKEPASVI
ncbi:hypothetical protein BSL78_23100 [Apostichopus japonicus]|uniref:Uncharacterized protein n=1 Tax=Stichopus japonicus TaxID=307972 RepID=A0A2G8JWB9_STIJA|nr:hypothetical protein BSL78_23100 [Apostichopus japonicus]